MRALVIISFIVLGTNLSMIDCQCAIGQYGNSTATCTDCPPHTISAADSKTVTECRCLPGHQISANDTCTVCKEGECCGIDITKKPTIRNHSESACASCPINTILVISGTDNITYCYCATGYGGVNGSVCGNDATNVTTIEHTNVNMSTLKFTSTLNMEVIDFNQSQRKVYVAGVARALGIEPKRVIITTVRDTTWSSRRLLASTVVVETTVRVPKEQAITVAESATPANINTQLASSGITVEAVSVVTITEEEPSESSSMSREELRQFLPAPIPIALEMALTVLSMILFMLLCAPIVAVVCICCGLGVAAKAMFSPKTSVFFSETKVNPFGNGNGNALIGSRAYAAPSNTFVGSRSYTGDTCETVLVYSSV